MFKKLQFGLKHLSLYTVVNSGIDYDVDEHFFLGTIYGKPYFWVMLKEPISKNNTIYSLLKQQGWEPNDYGTVWRLV